MGFIILSAANGVYLRDVIKMHLPSRTPYELLSSVLTPESLPVVTALLSCSFGSSAKRTPGLVFFFFFSSDFPSGSSLDLLVHGRQDYLSIQVP